MTGRLRDSYETHQADGYETGVMTCIDEEARNGNRRELRAANRQSGAADVAAEKDDVDGSDVIGARGCSVGRVVSSKRLGGLERSSVDPSITLALSHELVDCGS